MRRVRLDAPSSAPKGRNDLAGGASLRDTRGANQAPKAATCAFPIPTPPLRGSRTPPPHLEACASSYIMPPLRGCARNFSTLATPPLSCCNNAHTHAFHHCQPSRVRFEPASFKTQRSSP